MAASPWAVAPPEQITSQWRQAAEIDLSLLQFRTRGNWWAALQDITLIISREYEHMLIALISN